MGDFSVPCVISGLPIASRSPVVGFQIKKARYECTEFPFAPISLPFYGIMGDYGRVEDRDRDDEPEKKGIWTVYAHVALFDAAANIFRQAMPKEGSLYEEHARRRAKWQADIELYNKLAPGGYETEKEHIDGNVGTLPHHNTEPHLALMHHILICVSDDNTFETDLGTWLNNITRAADFEQHKDEIDDVEKLMAVFAAQKITGHPIVVPGYTFEQYPTYHWETMWHAAVLETSRRYRTLDKWRDREGKAEDLLWQAKEATCESKKTELEKRAKIIMDTVTLQRPPPFERIKELLDAQPRQRLPMQKEIDALVAQLNAETDPDRRQYIKNMISTISYQCGIKCPPKQEGLSS